MSRVIGIVSVVVGGGSLVAFGGFLWLGSFHCVDLRMDLTGVLIWDGFLSMVFFMQHSGMIRRSFRRRLAGVVPGHLDHAVYSIGSGVVLSLVLVLWQRSLIDVVQLEGPWRWPFRIAFVAAVVGFVSGLRALHGFDGFGLRAIRHRVRGRQRPEPSLIVDGPYRWVRHPLYSCVLIMIWSCPDLTADRLLFNLLWTGWIVLGTALEEQDLEADFGERFRAYRRRVPMLVPWTLRPRWPGDGSG
ncbi:MAG: isoprenylcysteine carboxylmethyltransferase family protein [Holophagae bacterium]|jgi:protein-S-isoprenylcysteine O-methyltransferase Ste14